MWQLTFGVPSQEPSKGILFLYPFKERNVQIKGEHRDLVGRQGHGSFFVLSLGRSSDILFSMSFFSLSIHSDNIHYTPSGSPGRQFFSPAFKLYPRTTLGYQQDKEYKMDTINSSANTSRTVMYGPSDLNTTEENATRLFLQKQETKEESDCVSTTASTIPVLLHGRPRPRPRQRPQQRHRRLWCQAGDRAGRWTSLWMGHCLCDVCLTNDHHGLREHLRRLPGVVSLSFHFLYLCKVVVFFHS